MPCMSVDIPGQTDAARVCNLRFVNALTPGHFVIILVFLLIPLGCGYWASAIARKKDRSAGGFFALGFFLGVIGLIIAAVVSPGQPGPPAGMHAVVCPRCNARQNADPRQPSFECWQCKTVSSVT
jgi:hypothetical protein